MLEKATAPSQSTVLGSGVQPVYFRFGSSSRTPTSSQIGVETVTESLESPDPSLRRGNMQADNTKDSALAVEVHEDKGPADQ